MPKRRSHKRSPTAGVTRERIRIAEKQGKALELRKAGQSYRAIAKELGYAGPGGAHKAVASGLRLTLQEPADDVRQLEMQRLDRMLESYWPAVLKGDPKAGGIVIRSMDRRATYLGLDAPVKIDLEQRIRDGAIAEGLDPDEAVEIARQIIRENRW